MGTEGWRWGQEGRSKASATDMLLEKEHPAAVPPALSILRASGVRVGSGLQGGKGGRCPMFQQNLPCREPLRTVKKSD